MYYNNVFYLFVQDSYTSVKSYITITTSDGNRSYGRHKFSIHETVCAFQISAIQTIKNRMEDKCFLRKVKNSGL